MTVSAISPVSASIGRQSLYPMVVNGTLCFNAAQVTQARAATAATAQRTADKGTAGKSTGKSGSATAGTTGGSAPAGGQSLYTASATRSSSRWSGPRGTLVDLFA